MAKHKEGCEQLRRSQPGFCTCGAVPLSFTPEEEEKFEKIWEALLEFFAFCPPSMNEPDESGIDATTTGVTFDNAGHFSNELRVTFHKRINKALNAGLVQLPINMADLIGTLRYLGSGRNRYHRLYSEMDEIGSKIVDMINNRRSE